MARFVLKDPFYKKAKEEGFRARSVYKLKDIDAKYHCIRKGDTVLDLGCSPGSFLQALSEMVGEKGFVIGIDILPTPALSRKNVTAIKGDIREIDIAQLLAEHGLKEINAVTCDIAPNLSGIREVDDARIEELFHSVLDIVVKTLKPGGNFIVKSFSTTIQKDITTALQKQFSKVSPYKPPASRAVSPEIFFVCMGKK
jgi:23S rRNA (uridine2552-2'-O)-methyltransferase